MNAMKKLYKIFTLVETYFLFSLFLFTSVAIVVNVLGRKIFGFSFNWLEEFARYVLIIIAFVGMSIAVTRGIHPKMDAVQNIFKGRAGLAIKIIAKLIFALAMCALFYYSLRQMRIMIRFPASTATLKIPLYAIFAFLSAGFLGASIRSLIDLALTVKEYILYTKGETEGENATPDLPSGGIGTELKEKGETQCQ